MRTTWKTGIHFVALIALSLGTSVASASDCDAASKELTHHKRSLAQLEENERPGFLPGSGSRDMRTRIDDIHVQMRQAERDLAAICAKEGRSPPSGGAPNIRVEPKTKSELESAFDKVERMLAEKRAKEAQQSARENKAAPEPKKQATRDVCKRYVTYRDGQLLSDWGVAYRKFEVAEEAIALTESLRAEVATYRRMGGFAQVADLVLRAVKIKTDAISNILRISPMYDATAGTIIDIVDKRIKLKEIEGRLADGILNSKPPEEFGLWLVEEATKELIERRIGKPLTAAIKGLYDFQKESRALVKSQLEFEREFFPSLDQRLQTLVARLRELKAELHKQRSQLIGINEIKNAIDNACSQHLAKEKTNELP